MNFHTVVEKKGIITFPLSHQNRSQHVWICQPCFFKMILGNSCLNAGYSCPIFFAKKTGKMSQCASNVRTCSKIILKNLTIHLGAPNRSHQTCSGLWAPAPGHILRSAHVPTFTVPFQFLNAFKLKQELSGENVHELNSCLQISYRNSRLNWISRLQSIYLPDCEKVYFLCSAQNISLNGDLGIDGPLMSGDFPWLRCQRLGFLSLQIGLPHFSWWERSFLAQNNNIYILYTIYL